MIRRSTPWLILAILLIPSTSFAQQKRSVKRPAPPPHFPELDDAAGDDLSPLLADIVRDRKVPGMAAALIKGREVVATGVAGVRKSGERDEVTIEDKWHLGSDTKAMTATLCGILVDEDKLRWDLTLAECFPDLAPKMDAGFRSVTLEQLLTNRGGCPANLDRDGLWKTLWDFKGTPTEARRALLEGVTKHPPEYAPGSKFVYSNANFAIAGHMAETVMKTPWEELITRKLFDPLQMFSIGFGAPGTKAAKPPANPDPKAPPVSLIDQPRGHRSSGTPVEPGPTADNPVAIGPAGIVHCTIADWAKFITLHLRAAEGDYKLLKPETFQKLHQPAAGEGPKYAMGWIVTSRAWAGEGERVLTHAGSNTMWYCTTWIAPEKDLAILITCNQGGDEATKACDDAAMMLIREAVRFGK